jgi:CrcB protein
LLMPASILGVLARLGLQALVTYDGQCVFPLAYVQATGCFIMGLGLGLKEPLGNLYVSASVWLVLPIYALCSYGPLYTAITTGD